MEASNQFEAGIALGLATFASLDKRGQKWRTRNAPAYIREQLWKPYYITARQGGQELFIIRPPDAQNQKVYFARWPPSELHEK